MRPCHCDKISAPSDGKDYCRRCWKWHHDPAYRAHCEDRLIRINHGAGGLGDAIQGMLAVRGFRNLHPDAYIVYRVGGGTIPFVNLFDGGYDALAPHDPDHTRDEPPNTYDLQLNLGYNQEVRSKGSEPRWSRYCRNLGVEAPVLPQLKDAGNLLASGISHKGSIALAPFCSSRDSREWPLRHWLTLEDMLRKSGRDVRIIDHRADKCRRFASPRIGSGAELVVSTLLNAAILVGNDSGMAHLSALLGRPTAVLMGQTSGEEIFGGYSAPMRFLGGHLPCRGCWWQPPYHPETCEPNCPSLATVPPAEVMQAILSLTQPK